MLMVKYSNYDEKAKETNKDWERQIEENTSAYSIHCNKKIL